MTSLFYLHHLLEGFLFPNTHVKSHTFLRDNGHKDALHDREALNNPLDCSPKSFLPSVVDRFDCMADHNVAEENYSDGNEPVEAKKHSQKKTETEEPDKTKFF